MATTKGQRIGIWIIAIFMTVGTIGSFAVIVLANQNTRNDQNRLTELQAKYQADVEAQNKELSDKYFETFNQYASRPAAFDGTNVTEIKTEDLKVGDGEELTAESSFTAYYIGWTPDGKVFDGSIDNGSLKAPFTASPGGVIEGWSKGVAGMKVGGVREITIPSSLAYAEAGSGESIPPNTPLKFVLLAIPTPEPIDVPQELLDNYQATGQM